MAFLAAFDPGDRVAMAAPFYPPYVNILTALGIQPVILEAGPETRFQPSVAMLERLDPRPDGLVVASPCNPAGTMLHRDELAAMLHLEAAEIEAWEAGKSKPTLEQLTALEQIRQRSVRAGVLMPEHAFAS